MTTINIHVHDGVASKAAQKTEPWNGTGVAGRVVKAEAESRYTLMMAYPANMPDAAKARDGFQDFANEAEVEKAAWAYMKAGHNVGLWHENGTDGAGEVVESYIYRGPDWAIKASDGTEQVIKSGDWLLGIQWGDESWQAIKDGKIGGGSMQGKTGRKAPTPADMAHLRRNPNAR